MYEIREGISVKDIFPDLDGNRGQQLKFLDMCRRADKKLMLRIIKDYSGNPEILHFLAMNGVQFDEKFIVILTRQATKAETLTWIYNRYHGIGATNAIMSKIKPVKKEIVEKVRILLALHPNTPEYIITALLSNNAEQMEKYVLMNKGYPVELKEKILVEILKKEDAKLSAEETKGFSNEERALNLEEFILANEKETLKVVAGFHYLDNETVKNLIETDDMEIKQILFSNTTLSAESYDFLAEETDPELLLLLKNNPGNSMTSLN